MIPLILRLKKTAHKDIAKAQDLVIEELYKVFDRAVLHGGTSIWRCYNGNRFSEDIDFYVPLDKNKINIFFEIIEKKGFSILKKKISEKSIFSTMRLDRAVVRLESVFKKVEGILHEYETVEGNLITVYTLNPEDLIKEKIDAYINRLKVRDLYDIFYLLRYIKEKETVRISLQRFIKNYKKPVDEKDLKILIIEGLVPTSEKMFDYVQNWVK